MKQKITWKYFNLWYFKQNFHGCKTIAYLVRKIGGFTKINDETRYLVLFSPEQYDAVYIL